MTAQTNLVEVLDHTNLIIITGHYGCGKTNLALNLAAQLKTQRANVTLVDLDIVNPYFRSSENTELVTSLGVEMVSSLFANTTLDNPAISPAVASSIVRAHQNKTCTIIDVGGDPEGALALGRFADEIASQPYEMLYVINKQRFTTQTPEEAFALLQEIEDITRLQATAIVANTHLKWETTAQIIVDGLPYAHAVADEADLPLYFITVPYAFLEDVSTLLPPDDAKKILPCEVYVRTPWESSTEF